MNDIVNLENSDFFHLPPGIEYPFTMRSDPGMLPVALAAVSGEGLSESQLFSIGYYAVRNRMGGLKGVQVPHPFGGRYRQMMVYVDPGRLQSLGLSAKDVVDALRESNLVLAAGTVRLGDFDYQVHPANTLITVEEIEAAPIAVRDGRPIFIRDVGYAKDDAALQYNIVRVNGQRSVYVPLLREPGRNTIAVVDRIREAVGRDIPQMKARGDIPESAEVSLLSDQSVYIRNAMRNLLYEVGLGAVLVTLVVAVFLRRLLPTLAIVAVIVLSILAGGLGFYFTGHTINVMTLGGLALAVGTVVDAGIVVVENIVRHLRLGKLPADAARDGAAEVAMPVLAGTATTLAVFIPVIFLTGMVQSLFEPLSVAATLTIGASYFVGMTVVPAFCARFVRQRLHPPGPANEEDEIPEPRGAYARLLGAALKARGLVIAAVGVLVGGSLLLLPGIGSELFPTVDAGTFELRVKTAPGTRLERTEELVARIEHTIQQVYLVMMAQFRSFVDPLIVVLAVPLGLAGVLAMLYLTGTTLNIQSLIGTLIMIGVAVNNSILLVEFANQLRARGYAVRPAALTAAQFRLRPILMTALVLVASMLPLSIQLAPGGEAMIPLARAVIGGMVVSTVLTLLLVPCVYTVLKRDRASAAAPAR